MHRPTMLDVLLMLRSESFASLPTPSVPVNHTDEHQAEALTLEGFWEVNVPLQPVEEMVTS